MAGGAAGGAAGAAPFDGPVGAASVQPVAWRIALMLVMTCCRFWMLAAETPVGWACWPAMKFRLF